MNETPVLPDSEFRSRFGAMLGGLAGTVVRDHAFFSIPSDKPPWFDSGLDLSANDRVTLFAGGRTYFKGTNIWLGPDFQLWCRIGPNGEIFRGTRATHTFEARSSGRLYLASYFPGEWATKAGDLATPPEVYELATGSLSVLVIRWATDPLEGLRKLAARGDVENLIASEIDRLTTPVLPPDGWSYLWFLGPAEIYRARTEPGQRPAIGCRTHGDTGILQREVSMPLKPNTRLRWSWKMDALPSDVREDALPTHDYLSIAVEFDNGQDLTYYWSAGLPVGTVYRCPIPTWNARETHFVLRSGPDGLGEWLTEERDVHQDYAEAIGGPIPANIVRVWLIALSLFQRKEGRCEYGNITFLTGDRVMRIE